MLVWETRNVHHRRFLVCKLDLVRVVDVLEVVLAVAVQDLQFKGVISVTD